MYLHEMISWQSWVKQVKNHKCDDHDDEFTKPISTALHTEDKTVKKPAIYWTISTLFPD